MSTPEKGYNINQTFIIETNEGDSILSACTALFTTNIYACTGNTEILLGSNSINMVGDVFVSGDLSATTVSATTYYGDGSNLTGISTQDTFVTGGTYSNGTAVFTNNTGGTFNVSGFYTGATDVFVTGGTYLTSASTLTFTNNTGGTFSITGITTSSAFTGGTVTGATSFSGGLTATTISATTYENLPLDVTVTGGSYSNGTAVFTNNTGGTFNVSGFYTGATDVFVTGATYDNANTFTFTNNTGGTFNVLFNTVTGLTVNGDISVNSLSASTIFSGGTQLNTIINNIASQYSGNTFVTGGTFNQSTRNLTLNRNDNVNIIVTGITDFYTTGATLSGATAIFTRNDGNNYTLNLSSLTGSTSQITGTTGSVAFFGTGNTITQDNTNFFWDNTNKRLGLRTNAPNSTLQINGSGTTSSSFGLQVHNATGNNNALVVRDDGLVAVRPNIALIPPTNFHVGGTGDIAAFGSSSSIDRGVVINVNSSGQGLITAFAYTPTDPSATVISAGANFGLNGSALNFFGIGLASAVSSRFDMWFQTGNVNGGGYRFYTGGINERLRIVGATGNVLIGTTTDASSRLRILGSNTGTGGTSTFGLQVHDSTGTNNALVVRDDGRVGIGIAAPTQLVHISRSDAATRTQLLIDNTANTGTNNLGAGIRLVAGSGLLETIGEIYSNPTNGGDTNARTLNITSIRGINYIANAAFPSLSEVRHRFVGTEAGMILYERASGNRTEALIYNLNGSSNAQYTMWAGISFYGWIRASTAGNISIGHGTTTGTEIMRLVSATNNVLIGTVTGATSSILTLESTTKGFLPPRNANPSVNITSPATGLVCYNTTTNKLQVYNGTSWIDLH